MLLQINRNDLESIIVNEFAKHFYSAIYEMNAFNEEIISLKDREYYVRNVLFNELRQNVMSKLPITETRSNIAGQLEYKASLMVLTLDELINMAFAITKQVMNLNGDKIDEFMRLLDVAKEREKNK